MVSEFIQLGDFPAFHGTGLIGMWVIPMTFECRWLGASDFKNLTETTALRR
jgi:hypothetical protein